MFEKEEELNNIVVDLDLVKEMKRDQKRYALLLACKDSEFVKKVHGGYFDVFVKAFGEEGESWDLFRVVEGEFPDFEELQKYDGFIVSGSPHDAYANDFWILRLCDLLQTLFALHKRLLGICFGHQVLCRALGGKVTKACRGWDIGITKLIMVESSFWYKYLQDQENQMVPHLPSILECHQDEVWDVPLGAEVIAFSERTRVEMFAFGDHILGIQGHPEYTKDILYNLIERLVGNDSIQRDYGEDLKSKLEKLEPDRKFWEMICKSFLKG